MNQLKSLNYDNSNTSSLLDLTNFHISYKKNHTETSVYPEEGTWKTRKDPSSTKPTSTLVDFEAISPPPPPKRSFYTSNSSNTSYFQPTADMNHGGCVLAGQRRNAVSNQNKPIVFESNNHYPPNDALNNNMNHNRKYSSNIFNNNSNINNRHALQPLQPLPPFQAIPNFYQNDKGIFQTTSVRLMDSWIDPNTLYNGISQYIPHQNIGGPFSFPFLPLPYNSVILPPPSPTILSYYNSDANFLDPNSLNPNAYRNNFSFSSANQDLQSKLLAKNFNSLHLPPNPNYLQNFSSSFIPVQNNAQIPLLPIQNQSLLFPSDHAPHQQHILHSNFIQDPSSTYRNQIASNLHLNNQKLSHNLILPAPASSSVLSDSSILQSSYIPGTTVTLTEAKNEDQRDRLLAYAHSIYSSNAKSPVLLPLLHTLQNIHQNHLPTILLLACVYFSQDQPQQSLHYNKLILSIDPNYVEAMSNIGTTLRSIGKIDEAERWWRHAVNLRPFYWDAVENLVGLLCSNFLPSDKTNSSSTISKTSPRFQEALEVCKFVETNLHSYPEKFASCLTAHHLPRYQHFLFLKGNIKTHLGDPNGAKQEYEKALELIFSGISLEAIIHKIVQFGMAKGMCIQPDKAVSGLPLILMEPQDAIKVNSILFPQTNGIMPAFYALVKDNSDSHSNYGQKLSTNNLIQQGHQQTSTILLTLAKLYQDYCFISQPLSVVLPLYYLSLALNSSPSTCNNLGIILSSIPTPPTNTILPTASNGTVTTSAPMGSALAFHYYTFGLKLDNHHPHIFTNLGSLLKDMGYVNEAIKMYEKAVECNPNFDVALANLGNAVKDMGRVQDSIQWYLKAVEINPSFVEAVCGLSNALAGVCDWRARSVNLHCLDHDPTTQRIFSILSTSKLKYGWMDKIVSIVDKQLTDGMTYGKGIVFITHSKSNGEVLLDLNPQINSFISQAITAFGPEGDRCILKRKLIRMCTVGSKAISVQSSAKMGIRNEGGWCIRVAERCIKWIQRRWFIDKYINKRQFESSKEERQNYLRPVLPSLPSPPVPTVLPFHTFTYPLDARQVRLISHRNALRISHSVLTSPWLPASVYPPPPPPSPHIKIGYISSDFNNHPLSHLMQSVFSFHDRTDFLVYCYATTPNDNSPYRAKIEKESDMFLDVSTWCTQSLVERIVQDGIHVLVNLNGYTKGAKNEVFAARPCPVQVALMGFAGTLGGEWCDWLVSDLTATPPDTSGSEQWYLRKRNDGLTDDFFDEGSLDPEEENDPAPNVKSDWVYTEKLIFMPHTYFVNDHRQGFRDPDEVPAHTIPDSEYKEESLWILEQDRRWKMRKELFPNLRDDVFIFANFNQLYKIDPVIFHVWLRILKRVPNAILWLLRFPASGETHLQRTAHEWAGDEVASRVIFTDVAPKQIHIHRGRIADIFLDTPECNAHTTATDILWSGTPIITYPRNHHKMCSRVAASVANATGLGHKMTATSESEYEDLAVRYALGTTWKYVRDDELPFVLPQAPVSYQSSIHRMGYGEIMDIRKHLFLKRDRSILYDTPRWVRNLEKSYKQIWQRWVSGQDFEDPHDPLIANSTYFSSKQSSQSVYVHEDHG